MFNQMVERHGEHGARQLDRAFGALADPSRRAILDALRGGEKRITELARPLPMSLNAVSKHVQVLERGGLVRRRVQGREHLIALAPVSLGEVAAWIDSYRQFWEPRLDSLEALLVERRGEMGIREEEE